MKFINTTYFIFILIIVTTVNINAQGISHPWHTIDHGGSRTSAEGFTLISSMGQEILPKGSQGGFTLEGGYLPGQQHYSGNFYSVDLSFEQNWNLISLPLLLSSYAKSDIFPVTASEAFAYSTGYVIVDTLHNGAGYWLKFAEGNTSSLAGVSIATDTLDVNDRWNLIGSISYPIPSTNVYAIPPAEIQSLFFGFSNNKGYSLADTLQPGKGYWVRMSAKGSLVMSQSPLVSKATPFSVKQSTIKSNSKIDVNELLHNSTSITFRDYTEKERSLYLSIPSEHQIQSFDLPPSPPAGIFDARFHSNTMMEFFDVTTAKKVIVNVSSGKYPVEISWTSSLLPYQLVIDGTTISLNNDGKYTLNQPASSIAVIYTPLGKEALPTEFALEQNYPNPFNPVTAINYSVAQEGFVTLSVYNTLGEKVISLVNEIQDAGFKSVTFDASFLSSGLYMYQINIANPMTGDVLFTNTKKAVVMK